MSEDDVMRGFVRLKSLLMEAEDEFGSDFGKRLVASAMKFSKENAGVSTAEAYYAARDELRRHPPTTSIDVGQPHD